MTTRLNRDDAFRLDGRMALVTGASGWLGRAVALELSGAGATVLMAARESARLEPLRLDIEAAGGSALAIPVAGAEVRPFSHFFGGFAAAGGRLDILVTVEEPPARKAPETVEKQDFIAAAASAIVRPFELTRAALPLLEKAAALNGQAAVVIVAASPDGPAPQAESGGGHGPHLGAARAGMRELTRHMARTLGPRGVRVNGVMPDAVLTPAFEAAWPAVAEALKARVPLGRLGAPEEVAQAVRFFASGAAAWITGACLAVDGGRSARRAP